MTMIAVAIRSTRWRCGCLATKASRKAPDLSAGAILVDDSITVDDPDDTDLESATVQITGNYIDGVGVPACVAAAGRAAASVVAATARR